MPWTREEKYFALLLIWIQNHLKLRKQKFAGSLTLTTIPQKKPNLSLGTQILSHRVSKQPKQEGRKSQIWQEDDYKMSWQCGWGERLCREESE